ncbi:MULTISPECIES: hypothetical protein [unclassified Frankia]|uniref:hypothetical protein n=1 Tax=unclassified Frankia TaxID=2632575 RepID=UPI0020244AEF
MTEQAPHDPGRTVPAGWALMGKEPNSEDDYAVLRSGGDFFSRAGFDTILQDFTPGTPPWPVPQPLPNALPWMTVSYASHGEGSVLGIAVRTWSDQVDGGGRQIATTGYLCVPFADLARVPTSYATLYSALRDAGVAERRDGDGPVPVTLTPLDAGELAEHIERFGFALVAATAGLLLAHPVSVLDAPAGHPDEQMVQRLRFLDAVAALLPYGQRSKLVASTWADGGSIHRIRLAFTNRARPEHAGIRWVPPDRLPVVELSPSLRQPRVSPDNRHIHYAHLLMAMKKSGHTVQEIVEHLASAGEPHRTNDPGHAIHCLSRLDAQLASSVHPAKAVKPVQPVKAVKAVKLVKSVQPLPPTPAKPVVARPRPTGRAAEEPDRNAWRGTVWGLLETASPEGLAEIGQTWPEWTARKPKELQHWLAVSIGTIGRRLLWASDVDLTAPERLLGLADRLGLADQALAGLLDAQKARQEAAAAALGQPVDQPASDQPVLDRQRCATAASLVLRHFRDRRLPTGRTTVDADDEVLTAITYYAPESLARELVRQAADRLPDEQIKAMLAWLETAGPLRERLRPFRDVIDGASSEAAALAVGTVREHGGSYVLALLQLARKAGGFRAAAVLLPYALQWMLSEVPALLRDEEDRKGWVKELRWAVPDRTKTGELEAVELEAVMDLLLLAFGEQPREDLKLWASEAGELADSYVSSFRSSFMSLPGNSDTKNMYQQIFKTLTGHVRRTGWPDSPPATNRILLLLRDIATKSGVVKDDLLADMVLEFFDHLPRRDPVRKLPGKKEWDALFKSRYPRLTGERIPLRKMGR